MEAAIWGVPGVAVSLDTPENHLGDVDYGPAARFALRIVDEAIQRGLPKGILLNVNVPYLEEDQIQGVRITRQGLRVYRDMLDQRKDPRGRPYYWIGGEAPTGVPEDGTDIGALNDGFVSITPLGLDLTAHRELDEICAWGMDRFCDGEVDQL
jgi:5'-nucleotidase